MRGNIHQEPKGEGKVKGRVSVGRQRVRAVVGKAKG